jgi:hypothetical protein
MEVLDGDVVRLSSRGREAERDIVQVSVQSVGTCINCVIGSHIPRHLFAYAALLISKIYFRNDFRILRHLPSNFPL